MMRTEYHFDYSRAKPNRYAKRRTNRIKRTLKLTQRLTRDQQSRRRERIAYRKAERANGS